VQAIKGIEPPRQLDHGEKECGRSQGMSRDPRIRTVCWLVKRLARKKWESPEVEGRGHPNICRDQKPSGGKNKEGRDGFVGKNPAESQRRIIIAASRKLSILFVGKNLETQRTYHADELQKGASIGMDERRINRPSTQRIIKGLKPDPHPG